MAILNVVSVSLFSQNSCAPVPAGTASWWRADWNARDAMGNHNCDLKNGASFAPGKVGMAFKFDSISDQINQYVGPNKTYGLAGGQYGAYPTALIGNFTINFWAKTERTKTFNAVIRPPNGGIFPTNNNTLAGIGVRFGTDGVMVGAHDGNYLPILLNWDSPTPLTDWTHIAVVFENNLPKIYFNAQLVAEMTQLDGSGHIYFPGPGFNQIFGIGGGTNAGGANNFNFGYFVGLIDELQIISIALTQSQIQLIFDADSNGQCIPTTIAGSVINDVDSNCVLNDTIDFPIANRLIQATPGPFFAFTDNDGNYELLAPDGNYDVTQAAVANDIFNTATCPPPAQQAYNVTVSGNALIAGKDFIDVLANHVCNIAVNIQPSYLPPLSSSCPGITQTYCVTFTNNGPSVTDPVFSMTVDPKVTILSFTSGCGSSCSSLGQTVTCTGISFNPGNPPCSLCVTVDVPGPPDPEPPFHVQLGDILITNASISGTCGGDAFTSNAVPLNETVTCAIDPNDKLLVTPKGCGPFGNISGDETLIYRIRFQNTGNAPAHNIVLLDELDEDLDLTTLKIIASSHTITKAEIVPAKLLRISFIGIGLPDSTSNPTGSNGFVVFSIKPKSGLIEGTTITNEAEIYFDLNEPVITNSTLNTIRNVLQPVTLSSFSDVCVNDSAFALTSGTPAGGSYSGNGVSNEDVFATVVPGRNANSFSITNDFVQFIPSPVTGECSNSAQSAITVKPLPTVSISTSGPTTFCEGDSVLLTAIATAIAPVTYQWSNGATTPSIVVSATGEHTVIISDFCGSDTSAPVTVTVKPQPTATITAGGSTNLCPGQSVTLTASTADSYLWSNGATTQSITVSVSGTFSVTVTANGCSAASEPVNVIVNNVPCGKDKLVICHLPPGNSGNPQTLCVSTSSLQAHIAHGDYCGPCIQNQAKTTNETNDWCGWKNETDFNKSSSINVFTDTCNMYTTCRGILKDPYIPTDSTPVKYFTLIIVVVDSNLYGVTPENIDTMMYSVNNYFNPWKIQFCYTTDFIDNSLLSSYPKNADSVMNVVIQDWPNLGLSGNPIKIDYSVVINNNYQGGYSLAHELGHNFQLLHTFSGLMGPPYDNAPCSNLYRDRVDYMPFPSIQDTVGDGMSDTPPTPINNNCSPPMGVDTCSIGNPSWPAYGYENLMGYSYCTNATFSPKQAGKMHCAIECGYLPNNISNYPAKLAYGMSHCAPSTTAISNVNKDNKLRLEIMPNPFNDVTTINFTLPYNDKATVEIYNYLGQQVAKVFEQDTRKKQVYKIELNGKIMPNGIYFVVVKTSSETQVKMIVAIK